MRFLFSSEIIILAAKEHISLSRRQYSPRPHDGTVLGIISCSPSAEHLWEFHPLHILCVTFGRAFYSVRSERTISRSNRENMADPPPTYELPKHPYGGRAPMTMGISWALTAIAIILMVLRTYTNKVITKSFGWDYHWAAITLVSPEFPSSPEASTCKRNSR